MRPQFLLDNLLYIVYVYDEYEEQYQTECGRKLPAILIDNYPFLFTEVDEKYKTPVVCKFNGNSYNADYYRKKLRAVYHRIDYLNCFRKRRQVADNEEELARLRKLVATYNKKIIKLLTT